MFGSLYRPLVALLALLIAVAALGRRRGYPRRPAHLGRSRDARSHVARSGGDAGDHHAVHDHVRPPRRHGEGDARQSPRAEPRGILESVARRADLRVRPAQGRPVPQRRPRDRRGREVLLRALSGRRREDAQGAAWPRWRRPIPAASASGSRSPGRTSSSSTRPPAAPAGSCPRSTSRRSATRDSRRRRSARGHTSSCPSRPASSWCSRPSSGTGARPRASSGWSSR